MHLSVLVPRPRSLRLVAWEACQRQDAQTNDEISAAPGDYPLTHCSYTRSRAASFGSPA